MDQTVVFYWTNQPDDYPRLSSTETRSTALLASGPGLHHRSRNALGRVACSSWLIGVPQRLAAGPSGARQRQGPWAREGRRGRRRRSSQAMAEKPPPPSRRQHAAPPGSAPSRLPPARRAHAWGGLKTGPRPPRCLQRSPTTKGPSSHHSSCLHPHPSSHIPFLSRPT